MLLSYEIGSHVLSDDHLPAVVYVYAACWTVYTDALQIVVMPVFHDRCDAYSAYSARGVITEEVLPVEHPIEERTVIVGAAGVVEVFPEIVRVAVGGEHELSLARERRMEVHHVEPG